MSLGLPDFTSRGGSAPGHAGWRGLRGAGYVVLVYVLVVAAVEWQRAHASNLALKRAQEGVAAALRSADDTRRILRRNTDLLIAAASVESSLARVQDDLSELLPDGVTITGLKVEYLPDAGARVEVSVVAGTPGAYDRFLGALSGSGAFSDIKPGSESRPGSVKATVSANHRPAEGAR